MKRKERKKYSTIVDFTIMLILVRIDSISLFSLAKQLVSSEFLMFGQLLIVARAGGAKHLFSIVNKSAEHDYMFWSLSMPAT